jgi:hypothetical protein
MVTLSKKTPIKLINKMKVSGRKMFVENGWVDA